MSPGAETALDRVEDGNANAEGAEIYSGDDAHVKRSPCIWSGRRNCHYSKLQALTKYRELGRPRYLSAATAHDGFGHRGRRRRHFFFNRLLGLAVENLADELLAGFGVLRSAGLGFDGGPLFQSDLLDGDSILLEVVAQPFLHRFQGGVVENEEDVFRGGGNHDVVDMRGLANPRGTQRGFQLFGASLDLLPLIDIALGHFGRLYQRLPVLGCQLLGKAVEESSKARGAPTCVVRKDANGLLVSRQPM